LQQLRVRSDNMQELLAVQVLSRHEFTIRWLFGTQYVVWRQSGAFEQFLQFSR
jgi:hypothetical protein